MKLSCDSPRGCDQVVIRQKSPTDYQQCTWCDYLANALWMTARQEAKQRRGLSRLDRLLVQIPLRTSAFVHGLFKLGDAGKSALHSR